MNHITGRLVLDLNPNYLEGLKPGTHTLTITFDDGVVIGSFRIAEKKENTPKPHTDNVVTCQMAGYPDYYAWNEAHQACEPGFIDDNGVFHSKKRLSLNTYDDGPFDHAVLLIASFLAAAAASILLLRDQRNN